jgi:hypothetical protein
LAVGSADTTEQGKLGFGLVTTYLSRPIVLHTASPGGGSDAYAINDQVNGSFLWSYGVSDRLELDFALPVTFGQGGAGITPLTGGAGLNDTAVRDMRFGFAYALGPHKATPSSDSHWKGITARLDVSAPTGDRYQFAGERSGVFVPSIASEYRLAAWFVGAELGARIRPVTQLLDARVGSQLVAALGVGVDILRDRLLSATLEAWTMPTLVEQAAVNILSDTYVSAPGGGSLVPGEWSLSARSMPFVGRDLSIQLGGGSALTSAVTSPRFRFTLAVRWAPERPDDTARRNDRAFHPAQGLTKINSLGGLGAVELPQNETNERPDQHFWSGLEGQ